jgi:hypothetical protein
VDVINEDQQFEITQIRELEFPNTARPTNGVRASQIL